MGIGGVGVFGGRITDAKLEPGNGETPPYVKFDAAGQNVLEVLEAVQLLVLALDGVLSASGQAGTRDIYPCSHLADRRVVVNAAQAAGEHTHLRHFQDLGNLPTLPTPTSRSVSTRLRSRR